MNYEYLTIEDAERLAKNKMDEQKAVEYLDGLKKRAFMTMNEVDLANLVLKYKNELSKEIEKNRKTIEELELWQPEIEALKIERDYLLELLRGEDNED